MARRAEADLGAVIGNGTSMPLWGAPAAAGRGPLRADTDTDVCVVGAGIPGLTLAYLLSPTYRVLVLERDAIGSGDTGRSSAHLTAILDTDYATLAKRLGEDEAQMAAAAHMAAIDFIERIVAEESIDCGFERVDGFLVGQPDQQDDLESVRAGALRAGLAGVALLTQTPFESASCAPCLRVSRHAQFDPLRYVQGLARAVEKRGGEIACGTQTTRVQDGGEARLETARGPIVSARAAVLATHTPMGGKPGMHARLAPYRTYIIAGLIPHDAPARCLAWDTGSPYHYVRRAPRSGSEDLLLVGGEDHQTGEVANPEERYGALEHWARERFPSLRTIEYRWSGQVFEPAGGLGYAGWEKGKDIVFLSAGHSGNGLTHGTLSALLLASLIQSGGHPWESAFDPGRGGLRTLAETAKHAVEGGVNLTDRLGGGDVESVDAIEAGEGAILGKGPDKVAVYRDVHGALWECSALCSHMGCAVRWNAAEQSWDCPCHGSRFDPKGNLLNGPAATGLAPASKAHPK